MAGSSKKTRLLKRDEVPPYLRFNRYIHTGYRPSDLTWRECLVSLTYFHNETVNILTHLVVIFLSAWGLYVLPPWEEITLPYFPAILSIGVMSPWLGSSIYHLFMNHHLGESLYQTLLHIDMLGIWITQTVGAIPQMVAATRCLPWTLRWSIFTLYTLLSFYALVKVLRATDAWARRLAFQLLFIARVCLLLLRVSPYGGGHPDVALHVLCQEAVLLVGSVVSATRIPERWWPGAFDYCWNSHNIMHLLVIVAMYHLTVSGGYDLAWLSKNPRGCPLSVSPRH